MTAVALLESGKLLGVFCIERKLTPEELRNLQYRTQAKFRGLGRGRMQVVACSLLRKRDIEDVCTAVCSSMNQLMGV
jgi:hypothetical protein